MISSEEYQDLVFNVLMENPQGQQLLEAWSEMFCRAPLPQVNRSTGISDTHMTYLRIGKKEFVDELYDLIRKKIENDRADQS